MLRGLRREQKLNKTQTPFSKESGVFLCKKFKQFAKKVNKDKINKQIFPNLLTIYDKI